MNSSRMNNRLAIAVLGCASLLAALLIAGLDTRLRDRISANETEYQARKLEELLDGHSYNNQPWADVIRIDNKPVDAVYPATQDETVTAMVIAVTSREGYVGPIGLLVATTPDGRISGIRIAAHRETPGLGDRIESGRSDWLLQFSGERLGDDAGRRWQTTLDGGEFDALSGATVTSRAVIDTLYRTLLWLQKRPDLQNAESDG